MNLILKLLIILLYFNFANAEANLKYYLNEAFKNNLKLNAERKNYKSIKENINISRSEFLPSISLSGDQSSTQSTNKTNQSGTNLKDSSLDTETKKISVDQKVFQGFKGYNSFKKSELQVEQASFKLKQVEQQTVLDTLA